MATWDENFSDAYARYSEELLRGLTANGKTTGQTEYYYMYIYQNTINLSGSYWSGRLEFKYGFDDTGNVPSGLTEWGHDDEMNILPLNSDQISFGPGFQDYDPRTPEGKLLDELLLTEGEKGQLDEYFNDPASLMAADNYLAGLWEGEEFSVENYPLDSSLHNFFEELFPGEGSSWLESNKGNLLIGASVGFAPTLASGVIPSLPSLGALKNVLSSTYTAVKSGASLFAPIVSRIGDIANIIKPVAGAALTGSASVTAAVLGGLWVADSYLKDGYLDKSNESLIGGMAQEWIRKQGESSLTYEHIKATGAYDWARSNSKKSNEALAPGYTAGSSAPGGSAGTAADGNVVNPSEGFQQDFSSIVSALSSIVNPVQSVADNIVHQVTSTDAQTLSIENMAAYLLEIGTIYSTLMTGQHITNLQGQVVESVAVLGKQKADYEHEVDGKNKTVREGEAWSNLHSLSSKDVGVSSIGQAIPALKGLIPSILSVGGLNLIKEMAIGSTNTNLASKARAKMDDDTKDDDNYLLDMFINLLWYDFKFNGDDPEGDSESYIMKKLQSISDLTAQGGD